MPKAAAGKQFPRRLFLLITIYRMPGAGRAHFRAEIRGRLFKFHNLRPASQKILFRAMLLGHLRGGDNGQPALHILHGDIMAASAEALPMAACAQSRI